jgi:hypothetical protein
LFPSHQQDYLKHSHKKPEELPRIQKLLTSIKELNLFLNQARRQEESVKQLSEIQQALVFPKGKEAVPICCLIHATRALLHDLTIDGGPRTRHDARSSLSLAVSP